MGDWGYPKTGLRTQISAAHSQALFTEQTKMVSSVNSITLNSSKTKKTLVIQSGDNSDQSLVATVNVQEKAAKCMKRFR